MEAKTAWAVLSVTLALAGTLPYVWGMIRNTNHPHAATWLIWSVVQAIACAAALSDSAGIGALPLAVAAAFAALICAGALWQGEHRFTRLDWSCLGLAAGALLAWRATSSALAAVVLVCAADTLGIVPTVRKSWAVPQREALSVYWSGIAAMCASLLALENYSLTTTLYPATILLVNSAFVAMLLLRRRRLAV